MPRRTQIIALIITLIVLIAAGVWGYFSLRDRNSNTPAPSSSGEVNAPTQNTNTGEAPTGNTNQSTGDNTTTTGGGASDTKASALRTVRIFVERYGTYSNRNDYENIRNTMPFMTTRFVRESEAFLAKEGGNPAGADDPYFGVTTSVLVLEAIQYTEGRSMQVKVSTQRVETKDGAEPRSFTQDAIVNATFDGESWKVDSIQWQ